MRILKDNHYNYDNSNGKQRGKAHTHKVKFWVGHRGGDRGSGAVSFLTIIAMVMDMDVDVDVEMVLKQKKIRCSCGRGCVR